MTTVTPLLSFSRGAYDSVLAHARAGAPEEVCGVLGGEGETVTSADPVPNVADCPTRRYEIDPEEQLRAIEAVESDGELLGFYHSHPEGPSEPSATDRAQATWADTYYVIVSLPEESVTAWYWTGEEFLERAVEID
ncbi:desampylase [Halalkalicoccus subterraneus]|uniref:desampylase n=1 Tax=Halalkalicoccus subterraneus TaxID=2675002 RepID=UPI001B86AF60|nr:desampylase [Halalkalicoccus subterraneus]